LFGNSCQFYSGRDWGERLNLQQDSMGSNPQPLAHEVGVKTSRHTHTHTHTLSLSLSLYIPLSSLPPRSLSLSLGIFNTNCFFTATVVTELAAILCYTYIARLVLIHFADLNGTDRTRVKNVMTCINLHPW
jgi:hypothetical protein